MEDLNEAISEYLKKRLKKDQKNYKEQELLRKKFVEKYPISVIHTLDLYDYVIGYGSENKSFCYCIENDLMGYGDIHGATAHKFGVYFSRENEDYVTTQVWSKDLNVEEAFVSIKKEIISLIGAGTTSNFDIINNAKISPMFKAKILATYYPEKYICIFSPEHIDHFCRVLDLKVVNLSTIEKNVAIVEFKNSNDKTKQWDNFTFQKFLYFWKDPRVPENTFTEEQFENMLFATDINAGNISQQKYVKVRKLNQKIQANLKKEYAECCQICGKAYDGKYGAFVVEGHHIEYFSKSENNNADNIILLCPNHHRIIHKLNPEFDRERMVFKYKNGYEDKIILDKHLNN